MLLGYGMVLVLLIMLAGITYRGLTSLTDTVDWVSHAQEGIGGARVITELSVDMEIGQRGFLITGEEEFLERYTDGIRSYETAVAGLKELVSDHPAQAERIKKIEALVAKWQNVAAQPEIAERRKVVKGAIDADYLQSVLAKGVGKGILDEMRGILDKMVVRFRIDGNMRGEALSQGVAKAMVDQETGERGFLITGKEEFLKPYRNGQEAVKNSISALRSLVANAHDRIATVSELNELEKLAEEWLKKVGNAEIELRRQVDAGQKTWKDIEDTLVRGDGKAILDSMRTIMDRMDEMFIKAENDRARILLLHLREAMINQETGQRGFIITGKDDFLEPFANGQKAFKQTLADLRTLNSNAYDIPGMRGDIDRLEKLAVEWLRKAAGPEIAAREQMNKSTISMQELQTRIEKGTGRAVMDSLRAELAEFVRVEEEHLDSLHKESDHAVTRTILTLVFGTMMAIVLGIVTALSISRSILKQVGGEPAVIAGIADEVAGGSLNVETPGNAEEATGILASITAMLGALRTNRDEAQRQQWLGAGVAGLGDVMRGDKEISVLGGDIISYLAAYLNAQVGTISLAASDNNHLTLAGTYAYKRRKNAATEFKFGEGLIGQAAQQKRRILVTDVPENYISVTSALGETIPRNILCCPFFYEGEVKGVIELGSLESFTEQQLGFLDQVGESMAIAVHSAQLREQTKALLEGSQSQAEELQAQQEELQAANEELEEKTAELEVKQEALNAAGGREE